MLMSMVAVDALLSPPQQLYFLLLLLLLRLLILALDLYHRCRCFALRRRRSLFLPLAHHLRSLGVIVAADGV